MARLYGAPESSTICRSQACREWVLTILSAMVGTQGVYRGWKDKIPRVAIINGRNRLLAQAVSTLWAFGKSKSGADCVCIFIRLRYWALLLISVVLPYSSMQAERNPCQCQSGICLVDIVIRYIGFFINANRRVSCQPEQR